MHCFDDGLIRATPLPKHLAQHSCRWLLVRVVVRYVGWQPQARTNDSTTRVTVRWHSGSSQQSWHSKIIVLLSPSAKWTIR